MENEFFNVPPAMIKLNLAPVKSVFILEDSAERMKVFHRCLIGKDVVATDNVDKAIQALTEQKFDLIFLDHDLDGKVFVDSTKERTGLEVIKCLCGSINENTTVIVHSLNPEGSANMCKAHPFNVIAVPFHILLKALES